MPNLDGEIPTEMEIEGELSGVTELDGEISSEDNIQGEINANTTVGLTPDIEVGTTETLPAGTSAEVELDEASTKLNPIFNFKIPKGDKPIKGEDYFTTEDIESLNIPRKTSDIQNDSNYVGDASYVHTDNNYSTNDKNKLQGIETLSNMDIENIIPN